MSGRSGSMNTILHVGFIAAVAAISMAIGIRIGHSSASSSRRASDRDPPHDRSGREGPAGGLQSRRRSLQGDAAAVPNLHEYAWIDLTYQFNNDTVYWPTSFSEFELDVLAFDTFEADTDGDGVNDDSYFYAANYLCFPEHGGTHLDSPIHFAFGKWTTEDIPLENLNGPGVVIDVQDQASQDPDYRLTLDDVEAFESENGDIPPGSVVMLRTGWGEYYESNDRQSYLGDDTPGDASNLHFPSYGVEAVTYLIEERNVSLLGIDTASIDYGQSADFIVHRTAYEANVPGLENVANLGKLPPTGSWIIALPMKIEGGSGGPVRIVALVPPGTNRDTAVEAMTSSSAAFPGSNPSVSLALSALLAVIILLGVVPPSFFM